MSTTASRPQSVSSGLLIAFDGIDSSGKETQVKETAARLRYIGHSVLTCATPDYTTTTGKKLQELLHNKNGEWHSMPWEDKMKLFAANRMEHRTEVEAALRHGTIVLYDRYVPSSLAFFTVEAQANHSETERTKVHRAVAMHEYETNQMPKEDVSLFLDVKPHVATRMLGRRKHKHQHDDEYTDDLKLQEHLYNEYDLLCQSNPEHYVRISCVSGTELLGIADITELIWQALVKKFPMLHDI